MRFHVTGLDRKAGTRRELIVDSRDREGAIAEASKVGIVTEAVTATGDRIVGRRSPALRWVVIAISSLAVIVALGWFLHIRSGVSGNRETLTTATPAIAKKVTLAIRAKRADKGALEPAGGIKFQLVPLADAQVVDIAFKEQRAAVSPKVDDWAVAMAEYAKFEQGAKELEAKYQGTAGLLAYQGEINAERKKQAKHVSDLGEVAYAAMDEGRKNVERAFEARSSAATISDASGAAVFADVLPGEYVVYGRPGKALWYWRHLVKLDGTSEISFDQSDDISLVKSDTALPSVK